MAAGTTHETTIPPPIGNNSSAGRSSELAGGERDVLGRYPRRAPQCRQHRVLKREHRQNRDRDDERQLRRDASPHDTVAEAAEDVHGTDYQ